MDADMIGLVLGIGLVLLALNVLFLIFRVYSLLDRIERLESKDEGLIIPESEYKPVNLVYTKPDEPK